MGYVYLVVILALATCHVWGLALVSLRDALARRRAARRAARAWGVERPASGFGLALVLGMGRRR